ncbi:hypothetical protein [Plantactinospora sonchi]|uniref:Uncharacterized protein n=1 Tax=Plantactinospora sonchi TaxID=1544735 RepID=A0ABU7RW56_9ACTN
MISWDDWRPFLRRIVDEGGDIGDLARAIRTHADGRYIQAGAALRKEFGLPLSEVAEVLAWAEAPQDSDEGLEHVRARVRTPLR